MLKEKKMACNPLLKEAFNGIEFEYKMDVVLKDMDDKTKLNAKELKGYLKKRHVKDTEVLQSQITRRRGDTRRTAKEWLEILEADGNPHHIRNEEVRRGQYKDITLNEKGRDNPSYKETISTIDKPNRNAPRLTHFRTETESANMPPVDITDFKSADTAEVRELKEQYDMLATQRSDMFQNIRDHDDLLGNDDFVNTGKQMDQIAQEIWNKVDPGAMPDQSLLGWRRSHEDTINGQRVLVLDEFQSDWAQAERKNEGVFSKTLEKAEEIIDTYRKGRNVKVNEETGELLEVDGITAAEYSEAIKWKNKEIVADFPMKPAQFQQYQIIEAINDAMEKGIDRIVIPIKRNKGDLHGKDGVTESYASLNLKDLPQGQIDEINKKRHARLKRENKKETDMIDMKVLPKIRKILDKQGMKIKLSSENYQYNNGMPYEEYLSMDDYDAVVSKMVDNGVDPDEYADKAMNLRMGSEAEEIRHMDKWVEEKYPGQGFTFREVYANLLEKNGVVAPTHELEQMFTKTVDAKFEWAKENYEGHMMDTITDIYADLDVPYDTSKNVDELFQDLKEDYLDDLTADMDNLIESKIDIIKEDFEYKNGDTNLLHTIDIVQKPDSRVKVDFYGLMGAVGLGGLADKLEKEEK